MWPDRGSNPHYTITQDLGLYDTIEKWTFIFLEMKYILKKTRQKSVKSFAMLTYVFPELKKIIRFTNYCLETHV